MPHADVPAPDDLAASAAKHRRARRRRHLIERATDVAPFAVLVVGPRHIECATPFLCRLLGCEPGDLEGRPLSALYDRMHPEDRARAMETTRTHLANDHATWVIDYPARYSDGAGGWRHLRWNGATTVEGVIYTSAVLTGPNGEPADLRGIL